MSLEELYREGLKIKKNIIFVRIDTFVDKYGQNQSQGYFAFLDKARYDLWKSASIFEFRTNGELIPYKSQIESYFIDIDKTLIPRKIENVLGVMESILKSNSRKNSLRIEFYTSIICGNFIGLLASISIFGFSKPTTDSYIGIIATLIGVIVAIVVGFQIYNAIQLKNEIKDKSQHISSQQALYCEQIDIKIDAIENKIKKSISEYESTSDKFLKEIELLEQKTKKAVIKSLCDSINILIFHYVKNNENELLFDYIIKIVEDLIEYGKVESEGASDFLYELQFGILYESYIKMAEANFTITNKEKSRSYNVRIEKMRSDISYSQNNIMINGLARVFEIFNSDSFSSREKVLQIKEYYKHLSALNL